MKCAWLYILLGAAIVVAVAAAALLFIDPYLHQYLSLGREAIVNSQAVLNAEEARQLSRLMKRGVVMTPEELISNFVSFYTTMLQLLGFLIAALGVIAFISMRTISKEHSEKSAQEAVSAYFNSQIYQEKINKKIGELHNPVEERINQRLADYEGMNFKIDDYIKDINLLRNLASEVKEINSSIEIISNRVAMLDNEEEEFSIITKGDN